MKNDFANAFADYKKESVLLIVVIAICATLDVVTRYLVGTLLDNLSTNNIKAMCLIASTFMIYVMSSYGKKVLCARFYNKIQCDMSVDLERSIIMTSQVLSNKNDSSYLINLFENDIRYVIQLITRIFDKCANDTALYLLSLMLLIWIHPLLALTAALCSAIAFVILYRASRKMEGMYNEYQRKMDSLIKNESNAIYNLEMTKTCRLESYFGRMSNSKVIDVCCEKRKASKYEAIVSMPSLVLAFVTLLTITLTAGCLAVVDRITYGELIVVITLIDYIIAPTMTLDGTVSSYKRGIASMKRIKNATNLRTIAQSTELKQTSFVEVIEIEKVSFKYEESGKDILSNLTCSFAKGTLNVLVGANGSGKTTIAKLLKKMYEYTGNIYFDGINIKEIDVDRCVSICAQDIFLYPTTIKENISMIKSVDISRIKETCKLIGIDDEIANMDNGYETILYDNGAPLSLGQRQRIMIARALMRDVPVYVFDEPTSAFNPQVKGNFIKTMTELAKNKLVIVIAHDVSMFNYDSNIVRL